MPTNLYEVREIGLEILSGDPGYVIRFQVQNEPELGLQLDRPKLLRLQALIAAALQPASANAQPL